MQEEMFRMLKRQEEQFQQFNSHFKFKEQEHMEATQGQGETSRNGDPIVQTETTGGDAFQTRPLRLEFPRFDGEDPEGWCYQASQFFDYYNMPDSQRFTISSFNMEGKALVWFQELRNGNNLTTWNEFLKAIQTRFGRSIYDDPMESLVSLKQTGSVEEYKCQFELLANRVVGLLENLKLSFFIGGLSEEIRLSVRMFNPKSKTEAYSLAKIQEELMCNAKKSSRSSWSSTQLRSSNLITNSYKPRVSLPGKSKMFQNNPIFGQAKGGNNSRALIPVQKISSAKMEERRKKGLCYFCDAKWNRGHVCEGGPKLFLIEEVETEELEELDAATLKEVVEEEPEISLNAITGTPSPKTMRIVGWVKGQQVIVLIDSGSTHNFLDENFAAVLGVKPKGQEAIKVKIANGQEVHSPSKCRELALKMQGTEFLVELYILPLAGCDVVLGIHWLRMLGPILWDFVTLSMEFEYANHKCVLRGLQ
jgi:hypothetical protein